MPTKGKPVTIGSGVGGVGLAAAWFSIIVAIAIIISFASL